MEAVTIYTLQGCRYCWLAKRLLRRRGIEYTEISTAGRSTPPTSKRRAELEHRFGASTFPQILVGDHHVEGWRDLAKLDRAGELEGLLGALPEIARPRFARVYSHLAARAAHGQIQQRQRLVAALRGRVVEVGAGSGTNFAYYRAGVTQVIAVEPEPTLRGRAEQAAATAPVPVEVVSGRGEALPLEDGEADAAVMSLVLCSVDEPGEVLEETRRALKPSGELRFYEHVAARGSVARGLQALADETFWPHVAGGCHMARDTVASIRAAGFELEDCDRWPGSLAAWELPVPHVVGSARSTATQGACLVDLSA